MKHDNPTVPYYIFEGVLARMERITKRLSLVAAFTTVLSMMLILLGFRQRRR